MGNSNKNDWFESWFDSPFYHILYKNRDHQEAENFIQKLISYLNPEKTDKLIDIACGKGRHALTMNKLGYTVDAFDLSKNSIDSAKEFENPTLKFYVNDIRNPLKAEHYHYAFNLFTSFGYFDDEKENELAIKSISDSVTTGGTFVMDFMNVSKVINNLVPTELKTIDGITFNLKRFIESGFIKKTISFNANEQNYTFTEMVKAISKKDFETYFHNAGLNIIATFGNYDLEAFDEVSSDRLIIIAEKL